MSVRTRRRRRAQALVEFALVVPWFFLLLFGIIEAGRFIFYYESLSHATREGARYAIVNGANTLGCPSGPAAPGTSACDASGANVWWWRLRPHEFATSPQRLVLRRAALAFAAEALKADVVYPVER